MKKLTPVYLTLMNGFRDHADYALEQNKTLSDIAMMREFCTLRIDGGRQSGKTEAIAEFCKDWLSEGNDVVVIAQQYQYAKETTSRILRAYNNVTRLNKHLGRAVIPITIRDFLSSKDKFRGISLKRVLVVIEEPLRLPEIEKFYKAYEENVRICTLSSNRETNPKVPLFFVMGIQ